MGILDHSAIMKPMSVRQMRETYCVYVHTLFQSPTDETGVQLYAGFCRLREVFLCPDAYKNSYWRQNVNDDSIIRIIIMHTCDTERECYQALTEIIKMVGMPIANKYGHQHGGTNVITCVEGPNAGKTYSTQERAAIENGIAQPSLSNHLNGRQGYATVRGMRFKRGL